MYVQSCYIFLVFLKFDLFYWIAVNAKNYNMATLFDFDIHYVNILFTRLLVTVLLTLSYPNCYLFRENLYKVVVCNTCQYLRHSFFFLSSGKVPMTYLRNLQLLTWSFTTKCFSKFVDNTIKLYTVLGRTWCSKDSL